MDWPPGAQGSTFGGNPVCCAAALATMELVEKHYMANATAMGKVLLEQLGDIATRHKRIASPRGIGLMCGVDVVDPKTGKLDSKTRDRIVVAAYERGLIMLGCGEATLRFCPALCINRQQIEVGCELLEAAVESAD
jgi:4-aminobutyrate aminotransferase